MKPEVKIFTKPEIMADSLAEEFYRYVNDRLLTKNKLNIALSGGNTPLLFFKILSEFDQQKVNKIEWRKIHFFWGDERCVPKDDKESNFGAAYNVLLSKINIPEANIHPIEGENNPEEEIERYSQLLQKYVDVKGGIPIFDWIFLGIGEDGHTASIFPDQMNLISSEKLCKLAIHPESGQKRITLTGTVLNMAKRITFIVAGANKQEVVKSTLNQEKHSRKYPAAKIQPRNGIIDWYLDASAAEQI
ncbi:6-phosphogluconolactonase [subsurface metagenome]